MNESIEISRAVEQSVERKIVQDAMRHDNEMFSAQMAAQRRQNFLIEAG